LKKPNSEHSDLPPHLSKPAQSAAPAAPREFLLGLCAPILFSLFIGQLLLLLLLLSFCAPAASAFRLNLTRPAFKRASCTFASSASWMALSASSSDSRWNGGVGLGNGGGREEKRYSLFKPQTTFYPQRLLLPLLKTPPKFPTASLGSRICPPCFTFDCVHCRVSSWISGQDLRDTMYVHLRYPD